MAGFLTVGGFAGAQGTAELGNGEFDSLAPINIVIVPESGPLTWLRFDLTIFHDVVEGTHGTIADSARIFHFNLTTRSAPFDRAYTALRMTTVSIATDDAFRAHCAQWFENQYYWGPDPGNSLYQLPDGWTRLGVVAQILPGNAAAYSLEDNDWNKIYPTAPVARIGLSICDVPILVHHQPADFSSDEQYYEAWKEYVSRIPFGNLVEMFQFFLTLGSMFTGPLDSLELYWLQSNLPQFPSTPTRSQR
jgi:hypothetical protein